MKKKLFIFAGCNKQAGNRILPDNAYCLYWKHPAGQSSHSHGKESNNKEIDFLQKVEADNFVNREKYLRWVHNLGAARASTGKSVVESLKVFKSATSFWWLSLLAEKSPFKSNKIFEAFKLMTLERVVHEHAFETICLVSQNKILAGILRQFCDKAAIEFHWIREGKKNPISFKKIVPQPVLAVFWLILHFWQRVRVVQQYRLKTPKKNKTEATILTYVPNFDLQRANQGNFRSHYWSKLHDWLNRQNSLTVNWIWIYAGASNESFVEVCQYKSRFQQSGKDNYYLLEEFLKPRDFFEILANYLRIFRSGWKLIQDKNIQAAFEVPNSKLNLMHLFRNEWAKSFWGTTGIENCLWEQKLIRVIETVRAEQKWGLYLCEFQPWEKILCNLWKKKMEHVLLIGYQHAAVGELVLNYHHNRRSFQNGVESSVPRPDLLAVNGPLAKNTFLAQGYPAEEIVEVEALRFTYLKETNKTQIPDFPLQGKTLLVVGDIVPENSSFQLDLLAGALQNIHINDAFEKIWVKPHPFCSMDEFIDELGLSAKIELVQGVIGDWITISTHVFAANSTSIALAALAMGRQAASCVSLNQINLSPLLGLKDGCIIRSTRDLVEFLLTPAKTGMPEDCYFNFETPISDILNNPHRVNSAAIQG